ncbi:MAG: TonB-dependent copper receptor [Alphaproteobacteria bacterium]|nr:TonB-dependent copper receptor [Alphaproteobacteria bacterium]HPF45649.1 TonB-dependent copper receptor [Emcibacteraceae bacterium]HRW28609.1 TonB-dependent copper receptor [Emcibacteraceae bacterium]
MYSSKILLGVLCAGTSLGNVAFSQEAQKTTRLGEVTVETEAASSNAGKSYYPEISTPSYNYDDGGDFLQSIPGVTASRFGGHGVEPIIRGQSQNQLNIIADNAFIYGGCPNRMDPPSSYLDINSFDEIIVTKGYQSVLNGPGASGGSVILERHAPELTAETSISGSLNGGYETNGDTWHSGANLIGGNDKMYVRGNGSIKEAGNYKDGQGKEVRSSFNERSGGVTLGFTPNENHFYVGYDIHQVDDALFPGAGMDSPLSKVQTIRSGFEREFDDGVVRKIDASAYLSMADHIMDNYSLRPAGAMLSRVTSESDTYGANLKTDFAIGEQILKTSVDFRHNNRDANRYQGMMANNVNMLQSVMWPDITAIEIGLAAETTYTLSVDDRLTLGGRYDYVNVTYGRANETSMVTGLSANDIYTQFYGFGAREKTEHNFGGLIRYEHDIDNTVTAFAGISRSIRTADATERGLANFMVMMGDNRSWVGNPELAPEKHHQFDVGLKAETNEWDFSVSGYLNRVSDYILRDSARGQAGILVTAPNADVYRNIDALLAGFEVEANWAISPTVRVNGDATYTYGENLDDNMPLAQIPPLQGSFGVNWQAHEIVELGANMRWAMKQTRVDTNPLIGTGRDVGQTSGYAVVDLKATITPIDPLTVTVGVSNLFDQTYANHLNRSNVSDPTEIRVNEAGRSFYLQAKMTF